MVTMRFKKGDVITNGMSAGEVIEIVDEPDADWKTGGVRIRNVSLEAFGGNVGYASFVPDYLLSSWRLVSFEWTPVLGSRDLQERFAWSGDHGHLYRDLRKDAK
jgi:hypothetical protein